MLPARSRPAACSASPDAPAPMTQEGPRARPASRTRRMRLGLLAMVALALAPGTFVRTAIGLRTDPAVVTVTARPERGGVSGELALTGVWELTSPHGWFGGFSALVRGQGQSLIAGSDRGFLLDIDLAGQAPRAVPGSFRYVGTRTNGRSEMVDLESLARDPASGTLWGGFESYNVVVRFAPGGKRTRRAPPAMERWGENSGPETMERLPDGRFLVIAEGAAAGSDTLHEALLFSGDPVATLAKPLAFRVETPAGYDPVDATTLPDGRVLILLRRVEYTLPAARFDTAIAIADPRAIQAGGVLPVRVIERMQGGIFADNFEGIAFVASADDPARGSVWVVTDNNFSVFQHSLLARFDWPGGTAAKPAP